MRRGRRIKRKKGSRGPVKYNRRRRKRRIIPPLPDDNVIYFSVISVIFPKEFEKTYRKVSKALNNTKFDRDSENMSEEDALTYRIKRGTSNIQARVHLYRKDLSLRNVDVVIRLQKHYGEQMKDEDDKKRKRKLWMQLIEPYVCYQGVAKLANHDFVDYYVNEIQKIHLLPLRPRGQIHAVDPLRYVLNVEMEKKEKRWKEIIHNLQVNHVKQVREKDLQHYPDLDLSKTRYFSLKRLLKALKNYDEFLIFENLMFVNMGTSALEQLVNIARECPWKFAISTVCKEFLITPIDYEYVHKFELVSLRKNNDLSFPREFYWANYIERAIHTLESDTHNMYSSWAKIISRVYDDAKTYHGKNGYIHSSYYDPIHSTIGTTFLPNKCADTIGEFISNNEDVYRAIKLLLTNKSVFMTDDFEDDKKDEKPIYDSLIEYKSNLQPEHEYCETLKFIDDQVDNLYEFKKNNGFYDDNMQYTLDYARVYVKESWNAQYQVLNCLRSIIANNMMHRDKPLFESEGDYTSNDYYTNRANKLQKVGVDKFISQLTMAFFLGLPGTGKTEMAKIAIDILDHPEMHIAVGGVNGITSQVLRERIGASFVLDAQNLDNHDENGEKVKRDAKVLIMTLDMMWKYSNADSESGERFRAFAKKVLMLIIDEMQNVDIYRLRKVLLIFPNLRWLRFMGDKNQIRPIMPGQVLLSLCNSLPENCKVVLKENNRTKKYKDPETARKVKTIVKNVESIVNSPYFAESGEHPSYVLEDNTPKGFTFDRVTPLSSGSHFFTIDNEKNVVDAIVHLYETAQMIDVTKISMISYMNKTVDRLNQNLNVKIRRIVKSKMGWKDRPGSILNKDYPNMLCFKEIFHPCTKIKFTKNYNTLRIFMDGELKTSNEVKNGETPFIMKVNTYTHYPSRADEKGKKRRPGTRRGKPTKVYALDLMYADGSTKHVIIGQYHVAYEHIKLGYFTTIDAMLGGQNDIMVFYLGDSNRRDGSIFKSELVQNLIRVGRDRIVTGLSRACRMSIVIAGKLEIDAGGIRWVYEIRESNRDREFVYGKNIRDLPIGEKYPLDCKQILRTMADLKPRDRKTDMLIYLENIFSTFIDMDNFSEDTLFEEVDEEGLNEAVLGELDEMEDEKEKKDKDDDDDFDMLQNILNDQ